eukprot:5664452-Pyramimonas_sp.AAC.1
MSVTCSGCAQSVAQWTSIIALISSCKCIQDEARLAGANTQREFLTNEAQLAERARLDREELIETVVEARN